MGTGEGRVEINKRLNGQGSVEAGKALWTADQRMDHWREQGTVGARKDF